jgi:hypothetical protein
MGISKIPSLFFRFLESPPPVAVVGPVELPVLGKSFSFSFYFSENLNFQRAPLKAKERRERQHAGWGFLCGGWSVVVGLLTVF